MENYIIQQIKNLFSGVDERDWQKVESTIEGSVLLDYSSMTGYPAVSLPPRDITKPWAAFLPGFDRTHHMLSDFSVNIKGADAEVHFEGNADHFLHNEVWTVKGSYDAKLKIKDHAWLVSEFKFREQGGTQICLPS